MTPSAPKPPWLRVRSPGGEKYQELRATFRELNLFTVCEEARCPNVGECWREGTATVMLLGDVCTRGCRFCAVTTGKPGVVDQREPEHVALAIGKMELQYVVLTMVDRDDLPDGGASHVARTVRRLRDLRSDLLVETLVGDFAGNTDHIEVVMDGGPDIFAHNLEVVRRITRKVRDVRCGYDRSLEVLRHVKARNPEGITKSSLMVGIGETDDELLEALSDLRSAGVDILTIGQYLRPGPKYHEVDRYVPPETFAMYEEHAYGLGFRYAASGPLVRSSYKAAEVYVRSVLGAREAKSSAKSTEELLRDRLQLARAGAQRVRDAFPQPEVAADTDVSMDRGAASPPLSWSEVAARSAVDLLRPSGASTEKLLPKSSLVRLRR